MKTTHYHIDAPFDLTAVLLADFHSCVKKTQSRKEYIGRILEAVKNANPDLILSTGDVFNNTDSASVNDCFNENGLRLLSGAGEIAPLYYSIGNHEHGLSEKNRASVESVGVTVLDNESTVFRGIGIGGLTTGYLKDKTCYTEPPVPETTAPAPVTITGTVKADGGLAVRNGAGTHNSVRRYLYNGTSVTVTETASVNGLTWGKISDGWICMNYVVQDGGASTKMVVADCLRVRSAPGTENWVVGYVYYGAYVTVYETAYGWGRIDSGWVSMDYLR